MPHCPECRALLTKAATENKSAPFCSDRCKAIDLGKWLREEFVISSAPATSTAESITAEIEGATRLDREFPVIPNDGIANDS